jgi:hypothetical protein
MARTIEEIQGAMLAQIAADQNLSAMNSTSKVALYRLFTFVVAFSIWALEKIFDQHTIDIDTRISEQKSGTKNWYKNKSLDFQYGFYLMTDSDVYDNTLATDEQIEASKIVKYCSVKESQESNRLIVKIASEVNEVLEPLTDDQLDSFTAYIEEIKYAGVKVKVVNNPADKLILDLVVFRDPLVLSDTGMSIRNPSQPIEDRIKAYMKELPFNGELVLNDMIEQLRKVPGVVNVHIQSASSSHFDVGGYTDFTTFNIARIPEAGYFKIENFDTIAYVV